MLSFAKKMLFGFGCGIALSFSMFGIGSTSAASADLTGTWINTSQWGGTLDVTQTATGSITWTATSNNGLWTQTFKGSWLTVWAVTGVFIQTEPNNTPKTYDGTLRFRVDSTTNPCNLTIAYAGMINGAAMVDNLKGLVFTKTSCASPSPSPSKTQVPPKIVWPKLPDALVPLDTVSNGCGGGDAGTDPKYGDDSEYINSEIPYADTSSWNTAHKYYVNFREACKQHDAAYSHAKVNGEMTLRGRPIPQPKTVDYFTWTKAKIDTKFLNDMIKICEVSIPKTAKIALNNCKSYGGFHTVSGAKTRYELVAATTYSQAIWKGLGFYQAAPALKGTWIVPGVSTGPWVITQSLRTVTVKWTGGSSQPEVTGEFRGTIISRDKDSLIKGYYVTSQNGASTSPKPMTFTWSPASPNSLTSSFGFNLTRS